MKKNLKRKNRLLCSFIFLILTLGCEKRFGSKSSKAFFTDIELYKVDLNIQKHVDEISLKFFEKDCGVKVIGYFDNYSNDKYRANSIINEDASYSFNKSEKVAGKTRTGYIWLNKLLISEETYLDNKVLKSEVIFLIAHEITHVAHKMDDCFQSQLVLVRKEGKLTPKILTFKLREDSEGNAVGFFRNIPMSEKSLLKAKELHADYAAGMILYDFILYKHDAFTRPNRLSELNKHLKKEYDSLRSIHTKKYDSIVNHVSNFIRKDLASSDIKGYGSIDERVAYFRKGVKDRKLFFKKRLPGYKLRNNDFSLNILRPLRQEGDSIQIKFAK